MYVPLQMLPSPWHGDTPLQNPPHDSLLNEVCAQCEFYCPPVQRRLGYTVLSPTV